MIRQLREVEEGEIKANEEGPTTGVLPRSLPTEDLPAFPPSMICRRANGTTRGVAVEAREEGDTMMMNNHKIRIMIHSKQQQQKQQPQQQHQLHRRENKDYFQLHFVGGKQQMIRTTIERRVGVFYLDNDRRQQLERLNFGKEREIFQLAQMPFHKNK